MQHGRIVQRHTLQMTGGNWRRNGKGPSAGKMIKTCNITDAIRTKHPYDGVCVCVLRTKSLIIQKFVKLGNVILSYRKNLFKFIIR